MAHDDGAYPLTDATWPALLKVYSFGMDAFLPIAPIFLNRRKLRGKEDPLRLRERLGFASVKRPNGKLIWIHAASIGEAVSMLPLIDALKESYEAHILITTGTVTSAQVMEKRLPEGVHHQYVPLDIPIAIDRFLSHWQPDLTLFAESEIWPATVRALHKRGIPVAIVNGRMSERSATGWQKAPKVAKALISRFAVICAQSDKDAAHYVQLGGGNVLTTGNLKYDVAETAVASDKAEALKEAINGRAAWSAISVHPGEQLDLISAHKRLKADHAGALLILVPRHPDKAELFRNDVIEAGLSVSMRTETSLPNQEDDVFIMDTIGEVPSVAGAVPVAFIGGTLIEHGGQNPMELIRAGACVLHGPHTTNFEAMFATLASDQAVRPVLGHDALHAEIATLWADEHQRNLLVERAQNVAQSMQGAANRTIDALAPLLSRAAFRAAD